MRTALPASSYTHAQTVLMQVAPRGHLRTRTETRGTRKHEWHTPCSTFCYITKDRIHAPRVNVLQSAALHARSKLANRPHIESLQ